MPKINILTEDLINKIAAGEVVQRPASVVKELIENSLDANSTQISIDIENSGKKLIRITDNGSGMDEVDAKYCILRHATSKIKDVNDLFSINTLGFRGEALSSIAAVSQLSIITKQAEKFEGFNLVVESGKVISSGILAAQTGTCIEVRNIFFNTPARMKFLKTDSVELRHIIDTVTRYALINPKVFFKLTHEGHNLLNSPSVENLKDNIASIYGVSIAKDLMEVNYTDENVTIIGHIAKPYLARNDKTQQSIYVNSRWIRNEELSKAIYDAFHSTLFVNKHPILILNLELNPEKIDVNVHPNKAIIKIEQNSTICNALFSAVKETLQKNNLIPVVDIESDKQLAFGFKPKETKYKFEESKQTILDSKEGVSENIDFLKNIENTEIESSEIENQKEEHNKEINQKDFIASNVSEGIIKEINTSSYQIPIQEPILQKELYSKLPPLKLLGQLHKTFFVAETQGGVCFIDQHAAHERVLYEEFMEQFNNHKVQIQQLLQPELIEFSPTENATVKEHLNSIEQLGFKLENFGENTFKIQTIPSIFGRTQTKEILLEIISKLGQDKSTIMELKEEIITRMSCRAAIMAGEEITIERMQQILNSLCTKELPFSCPHGRPTIIKTHVEELEKKFRRK